MDELLAAGFEQAPRQLTRPQKAAIVVRLLLGEGVDLDLSELPEELQDELVEEMARMRTVDHGTLTSVAQEFAEAVDNVGLAFKRGIAGALGTLGRAISPVAADRFRRQLGAEAMGDPWERIGELATDDLIAILEGESIEIGAVMLSKLKVSKAAELLGRLPGARARRIAYAMSLTEAVDPKLVVRIGREILDQIDARPVPAFHDGPVQRIGAILNYSASSTRDEVLEGLDATDKSFAEAVRRAIFTFANIPERIDPRDVAKVLRGVEQTVMLQALAAGLQRGQEKVVEFLFANMSQRMAAQLKEEIEALGRIKEKDGEAAMSAVISAVRELVAAGEIQLVAGDD